MKYSSLVRIEKITKEQNDAFIVEFIDKKIAKASKPGMFLSVFLENKVFRRPFAILDASESTGRVRFLFKVVGSATEYMSKLKENDLIDVIAPLGNSFDYDKKYKSLLVGGGVGIPPIHYLAKEMADKENTHVFLGASSINGIYLKSELEKYSSLHISTDDGSFGFNGNAVDMLEEFLANEITKTKKIPMIYACGSKPLLKSLKKLMNKYEIKGYFSFEAMMACAIGLCQGCALEIDGAHAREDNIYALCCRDGAIFKYDYIEI